MMQVQIRHVSETDEGTYGRLEGGGFSCWTLELPWRDNRQCVSRIPAGTYTVQPHHSSRFGKCLHVLDVPDRSEILFHAGNWAGDVSLGYRSDSEGCILVGEDLGEIWGQRAVMNSRRARTGLLRAFPKPFQLEIVDAT